MKNHLKKVKFGENLNYKISHVGYVVENINYSLKKFIREGAKVLIEPSQETSQRVWICLIEIQGGIKIELISPLDSNNSPIKSRLSKGGGLDHICFEVSDIEKALEQEKANGGIIICPKVPAIVFKNHMIAFVYRPSGLIVELME